MEETGSEQLHIYSQQPNNTVTDLCKDVKTKSRQYTNQKRKTRDFKISRKILKQEKELREGGR